MTLETLNSYLARDFGYFANSTFQHWRVIWSTDEYEVREVTHTKDGFELLHPEKQRVPKYWKHDRDKYILERCLAVPDFVETDLVADFSYEPIYVFDIPKEAGFSDNFYTACKFIIDVVYRAAAKSIGKKYKDPEIGSTAEETKELREQRLQAMERELFGDESDVLNALTHKQGVVVPRNFGEEGTFITKQEKE